MDEETSKEIEQTVLEILKQSNMDEVTEYKIRKSASEKLAMDLSEPTRKKFVRQVVELYLREQQAKAEQQEKQQDEEDEEEDEEENSRKRGGKEYDDEGGLIICRLSKSRRVTISEFRGKSLVSIREYYSKGGKELPSAKAAMKLKANNLNGKNCEEPHE